MDIIDTAPQRESFLTHAITIVLALGVFFCMYTPNYVVFNWWAKFAPQIAIGYWILGLLFLIIKSPRLTMVAFVSCAFLCLNLKNATNKAMAPAKVTSEPIIKIAQFNLNASNSSHYETINAIKKIGADVVSIQEVSLDWIIDLKDSLSNIYPYSCQINASDVYSMRLYSKYRFESCDTFYCDNIPNLVLGFKTQYSNKYVYIISSYIAPPLFSSAYVRMQSQLDTLASYVNSLKNPVITVGDYNIHGSSYEIQQFRRKANLNTSRRGYRPDRDNGHISFLEVPTDHIFYTNQMNCINFQTISGPHAERLGIQGSYQFSKDSMLLSLK